MSQLLNYALEYISRGYSVFPLHNIRNGVCSCNHPECSSPGKHPRTIDGLKSASKSEQKIIDWWTMWPDANIGILTGQESGIVVIDIDDPKINLQLPPTVVSKTGSGGFHFIFKHPGGHVKTTSGVFNKVDSRADGGYIVAPPSNHLQGSYTWIVSHDNQQIADCPKWWIDKLQEKKQFVQQNQDSKIITGGRNNYLTSYAGTLRHNGADYDEILQALLLRNKNRCSPPLEYHEVDLIARSVSKYNDDEKELLENIEIGRAFAEEIIKSQQLEISKDLKKKKKPKEKKPDLMPKSGLIKEIAEHILKTSIRPQPLLAVSASTALVGMLAGRKYRSPTNLRTNLYIVGIAGSGCGKDHARKIVSDIISQSGIQKHMGGSRIASGQGLFSALTQEPVKLYQLDEFGKMLKGLTDKRSASYQRDIVTTLIEAYSSAGSTFYGTDYADRNIKKQEAIINPHVCLYATSTPKTFYEALSSGEAIDGTVSRLLIVNVGDETRPDRVDCEYMDIPPELIEKVKSLADFKGQANWLGTNSSKVDTTEPVNVNYAPGIKEAFGELDDSMTDLMVNEASSSIYSRVCENAIKLALTYAVSKDYLNPIIDKEAFEWAREFALWSANTVIEQIGAFVADNDQEDKTKRLERVIESYTDGIDRSTLLHQSRWLKKQERDEILELLHDSGLITVQTIKTEKRDRTIIIHAKNL